MEDIGGLLLKQQVAEVMNIDSNDIVQFRVIPKQDITFDGYFEYYTVQVIYDCYGTLEVKEMELSGGEASRIGTNICIASRAGFKDKDSLDDLYNAYQEFIMTSGDLNKDNELSFSFDSKKIESYCKNR